MNKFKLYALSLCCLIFLSTQVYGAENTFPEGDDTPCCQEDLDGDCDVDVDDFLILNSYMGQSCSGCPADINGDGVVDNIDYDLLKNAFGLDCVAEEECCPEDITGDCIVDINDFLQFNSAYGRSCAGCPEDINGDGEVDDLDLALLEAAFGQDCLAPEDCCPEDQNGDCIVDINDFLEFNSAYGQSCSGCPADINGDGVVDDLDFALLEAAFGQDCGAGEEICCDEDITGDCLVDVNDFLALNSAFGTTCSGCPEDIDGDGDVDQDDFDLLEAAFGEDCGDTSPDCCPEDITGDCIVNDDDVNALNAAWGQSCSGCPEDINGDGIVDVNDFLELNSAYGQDCGPQDPGCCPEDVNGDCLVDINDFVQFNSAFGTTCNGCPEDIDGDGDVDIDDFNLLDAAFGLPCIADAGDCCPEDLTGDCEVDINDFLQLNSAYGTTCNGCVEDINGDGVVNSLDYDLLVAAYGSDCGTPSCEQTVENDESFENGGSAFSVWNKAGGGSVYRIPSTSGGALSCNNTSWKVAMRNNGTLTNYAVDLTDYETAEITFCHSRQGWPSGAWDSNDALILQARLSGSTTWTDLGSATGPSTGEVGTKQLDQYSGQIIDLRIRLNTSGGNTSNKWAYVDDIVISGCKSVSNGIQDNRPTDYKSISSGSALMILPNPAYDNVNLIFQVEENEAINVNVIDIQGKVVLSQSVRTKSVGQDVISLDVSNLSEGTYTVLMQSELRNRSSKLMIVR